jgi:hypothetical protein
VAKTNQHKKASLLVALVELVLYVPAREADNTASPLMGKNDIKS